MCKPEPIHMILMATLERHNCLGSVRGFWLGEWHKQKAQHHEAGPAEHEVPLLPNSSRASRHHQSFWAWEGLIISAICRLHLAAGVGILEGRDILLDL